MSIPEPRALKPSAVTVLHSVQTKPFPGVFLQQPYKELPVALSNLQMRKLRLRVGKGVGPDTSKRSKETRA